MNKPLSILGIGATTPLNSDVLNRREIPPKFFRQCPELSDNLAPKTTLIWTKDVSADQPDALGCSVFRCGLALNVPRGIAIRPPIAVQQLEGSESGKLIIPRQNTVLPPTSKSTAADSIRSIHRSVLWCGWRSFAVHPNGGESLRAALA